MHLRTEEQHRIFAVAFHPVRRILGTSSSHGDHAVYELPSRKGDFEMIQTQASAAPVERRTIERVPGNERHGRARDLFTVWFG